MARLRCILHPSDFSTASAAAFKRAVEDAKANDALLLIAHVLAPAMPLVSEGYVSPKVYQDMERSLTAWGQKHLDALVARAKKAGVRATGLLLQGGLPHEQIVRAARAKHCDVIIMGTHGRGAFGRLLLGSVAERVVATAGCPVLTVRGQ